MSFLVSGSDSHAGRHPSSGPVVVMRGLFLQSSSAGSLARSVTWALVVDMHTATSTSTCTGCKV